MFQQKDKELLKKTLKEMSLQTDEEKSLNKDLSQADLHVLYSLAYTLYETGDYTKSKEIFHTLISINPAMQKYWMGIGACFQMDKKFIEALKAWSVAAILDEKDPVPHFHAAECYFSLSTAEEGLKALDKARERVKSNDPLLNKIMKLQFYWNQESKEEA